MNLGRQRFVDNMILTTLHPVLKQRGFTRRGRVWNRTVDSRRHVIDVQSGKWSEVDSGDFTVNLGILVPPAYVAFWNRAPPAFARILDCEVRVRLGALMDGGVLHESSAGQGKTDHWWTFDASSDPVRLGQEVSELVIEVGLPFFESMNSLRSISEFLLHHEGLTGQIPMEQIHAAATLAALGERSQARGLLLQASSSNEAWRDRASQVARRLGIILDDQSV